MELKRFLENNWMVIVLVFLFILFIQNCSQGSKIRKLKKQVTIENVRHDSVLIEVERNLKNEIYLEGLRSEKRMIQSTDRKLWDLERQRVIDSLLVKGGSYLK
jgi:hypothetical protein